MNTQALYTQPFFCHSYKHTLILAEQKVVNLSTQSAVEPEQHTHTARVIRESYNLLLLKPIKGRRGQIKGPEYEPLKLGKKIISHLGERHKH